MGLLASFWVDQLAVMAKQYILLLIVACIHHIAYAASLKAAATGTAYDILDKNNLPHGLLPQGVQSYVLNPHGKLEVTIKLHAQTS